MAKFIQFGGELLRGTELPSGGLSLITSTEFQTKTVNIGTADAESAELNCGEGMRLAGYSIDAALVSTGMTYKVGHTAGSRQALSNSDGAVSHTVAASKNVTINPGDFYPWQYISFVAGTVQAGTICAITAVLASL